MQYVLNYKDKPVVVRHYADGGVEDLRSTEVQHYKELQQLKELLSTYGIPVTNKKQMARILQLHQQQLPWYYSRHHFFSQHFPSRMADAVADPTFNWKAVFKIVMGSQWITDDPRKVVKHLKDLRYRTRVSAARSWTDLPLTERYGTFAGTWLEHQIQGMTAGLEFVDNIRVAKCGVQRETRAYHRIQKAGCCGFRDIVVDHLIYGSYMIGCNHGH